MTTTPTIWKAKFPANVGTFGTQQAPQTIGLTNGNILVVWEDTTGGTSPGSDIMGQMFDAAGNQAGVAFQVNSTVVNVDETEPKIAALPDGGFVVAYGSYNDAIGGFIVVDRINSTGGSASSRFITDNNNNTLTKWEITVDAAGNYIVAFERAGNVKAIRFDHATNNAGLEFSAAQNGTDFDHLGGIAAFSNGNLAGNIVTVSDEQDEVYRGVFPFGTYDTIDTVEFKITNPATGEVIRQPVHIAGSFLGGNATAPSVAVLEGGEFVVVYNIGGGIALKVVASGAPGATIGPQIEVTYGHNVNNARVIALPDGGFFVAWADHTSVSLWGKRYDSTGAANGSAIEFANGIFSGTPMGSLALTSDDRILVTFRTGEGEISEVILDPRNSLIVGTAASEVLTTQTFDTSIFGAGGNDTILGQGGSDTIDGGLGDDTLKGGAGNDLLDGGTGIDTMNGGTGGDTYVLKDVHRADIFSKTIFDTVTEAFGAGTDTVRVQRTGSVSSYTLAANVENGIVDGADEFTLSGNSLGNALTGNFARNTLNGLDGSDVLNGGHSDDNLNGGAGNDTLIGGSSDDTINGNDGHDTLIGDIGADTFNGGLGDDTYVIGTNDFLNEDQDAGLDTVTIASSYTLLGNFENLLLTGGGAINGIGNALGNRITGNGAVNTLTGGAGNDVLDGESGRGHADRRRRQRHLCGRQHKRRSH